MINKPVLVVEYGNGSVRVNMSNKNVIDFRTRQDYQRWQDFEDQKEILHRIEGKLDNILGQKIVPKKRRNK